MRWGTRQTLCATVRAGTIAGPRHAVFNSGIVRKRRTYGWLSSPELTRRSEPTANSSQCIRHHGNSGEIEKESNTFIVRVVRSERPAVIRALEVQHVVWRCWLAETQEVARAFDCSPRFHSRFLQPSARLLVARHYDPCTRFVTFRSSHPYTAAHSRQASPVVEAKTLLEWRNGVGRGASSL